MVTNLSARCRDDQVTHLPDLVPRIVFCLSSVVALDEQWGQALDTATSSLVDA
jgi:hypothetical protein